MRILDLFKLTIHEVEVLRLMVQGYSYQEITRLLVLSPAMLQTYVSRIYTELNVLSRPRPRYKTCAMELSHWTIFLYSKTNNMEIRREEAGGMYLREGINLISACFIRYMGYRCHGRSNRKLR